MALLNIAEFDRVPTVLGPDGVPIAQLYPVVVPQVVAVGGASVQSTAMNAKTQFVRLKTDLRCAVRAGADPTAVTTDVILDAGDTEYFVVGPGHKIAVIAAP